MDWGGVGEVSRRRVGKEREMGQLRLQGVLSGTHLNCGARAK